ncbi:MAG: hypothetical protein ACD_30C00006G0002 [uncultured bacterium]|nr:MAG: hypothetical protein ACD_30C00006G0002 [uncultured bacterium]
MKSITPIAVWLVVIGAINWGLVGLLNMNLVENLVGMDLAKIVYILVGLAGLWKAYALLTKSSKK